jgi:hypothetical protein
MTFLTIRQAARILNCEPVAQLLRRKPLRDSSKRVFELEYAGIP